MPIFLNNFSFSHFLFQQLFLFWIWTFAIFCSQQTFLQISIQPLFIGFFTFPQGQKQWIRHESEGGALIPWAHPSDILSNFILLSHDECWGFTDYSPHINPNLFTDLGLALHYVRYFHVTEKMSLYCECIDAWCFRQGIDLLQKELNKK